VGKPAIRRVLREGLQWDPTDFRIHLDRLEVDGEEVVACWTCTSEQLPHPMHGIDRYSLGGGRIRRLETRLR
jgi:hypothetical protein